MSAVEYRIEGPCAVLVMQNPPVNGLAQAVRTGVMEALDRALADAEIKAVVITGSGGHFSGGADIREFNTPKMEAAPSLHDLIAAIERSAKPVVAAIEGTAMGGGLELALACHYRVATGKSVIALPEVKLGLLPGGGGTQRLPRVVGLELALNMIVSGTPVPAAKLAQTELFDAVVESGAVAAASQLIADRLAAGEVPVLVRDRKLVHADAEAFLDIARLNVRAMAGAYPAPMACLECVAASTSKPFDEGLRFECEQFTLLMNGEESKALRHAFFSERAASKIPDVPSDTPLRRIDKLGVIGAGTMGGGISMNFLNAGIPVTLVEQKQDALDRGVATMRGNYERSLKKGKLSQDKLDTRMALLTPSLSMEALADCDLIIEAVFEEIGVKQQVFEVLDAIAKPGAILASNTSTLDVDRIAGFTRRPADVLGMHFFSPANVMKLLEVVRGKATAKDALATVMALGKKIGKTAVVSGVCDGFIGNRMLEPYVREALFLVEEGASPQQVDKAMERFGMAMGPFRVGDLAGNDIGWSIRKRRYVERPEMFYPKLADRLCELGRFGQKVGKGWYRYEPGRRDAIPDAEVTALIDSHRRELGITPRALSDEEIVSRCVLALVNEGARLLEEGIAARASDLDVVYLSGYGFPALRGGPMHYADSLGLYNVARSMRGYAASAHGDRAFWTPAPLIEKLAADGGTFN
ncbi:3-hydroxyacyl-CoA dehydrogenase NAD-binding domain-containing protein [Algiphilus sp. W345]|uniref:3-hydroxyacyl-CoA dehydrogenase NAD-binding domain-containing protein n=1 Tax=Banduia mediterranea TaxID=3075609 RepID=A0ABU2WHK7_9GAMM|nr:3-hydroxyacyl-CoA dehydrogenase NAD-binding domain-containing protein [Algiphilus sp. W345]MDT0497360.1 3-hydroxyacyl-CoA dehydrogenase NAD-binding domain-containing protein [Algiphilus sp. W345]